MTLLQSINEANKNVKLLVEEGDDHLEENIDQVFIDLREDLTDRLLSILNVKDIRELNPFNNEK